MNKIEATIKNITELDYKLMDFTQERLDNLTKPQGSLGRLEELAKLIVGITREQNPVLKNKVIFTLAADHGVSEEGVSAYPKEVTAQMVYNFLRGGAGINVLAKHVGAKVVVVDIGVAEKVKSLPPGDLKTRTGSRSLSIDLGGKNSEFKNFRDRKINFGTKNFTKGPAMTREEAIRCIETGIDLLEEEIPNGIDIIGTGEMGIGNTTASSAITAAFTKEPVEDVTGRGTGVDDKGLKNKIRIIKEALSINEPDSCDAIDVLSKVGGFEIGGLAGIILAAASKKIPVVIDGFISGAAALVAYHIEPKVKEYMIVAHCSVEKGHRVILNHIGLKPILDLDLRLGEGTGAALGINIIDAAIKILTQMATFESAKVSQKKEK